MKGRIQFFIMSLVVLSVPVNAGFWDWFMPSEVASASGYVEYWDICIPIDEGDTYGGGEIYPNLKICEEFTGAEALEAGYHTVTCYTSFGDRKVSMRYGQTCEDYGYMSSYVYEVDCGNGRIDSGEECERNDLDGYSCVSLGRKWDVPWVSGRLDCKNCYFETSGCNYGGAKTCGEMDGKCWARNWNPLKYTGTDLSISCPSKEGEVLRCYLPRNDKQDPFNSCDDMGGICSRFPIPGYLKVDLECDVGDCYAIDENPTPNDTRFFSGVGGVVLLGIIIIIFWRRK